MAVAGPSQRTRQLLPTSSRVPRKMLGDLWESAWQTQISILALHVFVGMFVFKKSSQNWRLKTIHIYSLIYFWNPEVQVSSLGRSGELVFLPPGFGGRLCSRGQAPPGITLTSDFCCHKVSFCGNISLSPSHRACDLITRPTWIPASPSHVQVHFAL